jgi:hypothetical protein
MKIYIPIVGEDMPESRQSPTQHPLPSLLAGASLTLASLIIIPAIAQRAGMGPALTGALRAVLMKASSKV